MLTVRFATGISVTYNTARFLSRESECWKLYTADPNKGGAWIASIQPSAGAIVEAIDACKVEQAALSVAEAARLLSSTDELGRLDSSVVRRLKAKLAGFNAKTLRWI